ncbi:hypothetical protein OAU04_03405 [Alphaproteobacteria bacterium]|nr:hypothetical protein [Alphaproteobacteria bacterium]
MTISPTTKEVQAYRKDGLLFPKTVLTPRQASIFAPVPLETTNNYGVF